MPKILNLIEQNKKTLLETKAIVNKKYLSLSKSSDLEAIDQK